MPAEEQSRRWQEGRASCQTTGEKAEALAGAFLLESAQVISTNWYWRGREEYQKFQARSLCLRLSFAPGAQRQAAQCEVAAVSHVPLVTSEGME